MSGKHLKCYDVWLNPRTGEALVMHEKLRSAPGSGADLYEFPVLGVKYAEAMRRRQEIRLLWAVHVT